MSNLFKLQRSHYSDRYNSNSDKGCDMNNSKGVSAWKMKEAQIQRNNKKRMAYQKIKNKNQDRVDNLSNAHIEISLQGTTEPAALEYISKYMCKRTTDTNVEDNNYNSTPPLMVRRDGNK